MNVDNDDPKRIYSMTRRGIDFLKKQASTGQPFYMQMSYYAIHLAAQARQATIDKYAGKTDPRGGGFTTNLPPMLEELDTGIGLLLSAVRESGLDKNTYIFFGSDNGGAPSKGVTPNPPDVPARNAPLTGNKHFLTEGGIRVPVMVSGPGIPKNGWCKTPVVLYDLYATIHGILGAPFRLGEHIESADIQELCTKGDLGAVQRKTPGLIFHYPGGAFSYSAIRQDNFKLFIYWKPKVWQIERVQLFDLSNDIGETKNLAVKFPDKAKQLASVLTAYLQSVNAELPLAPKLKAGATQKAPPKGGTETEEKKARINDL
jgi:arylsulfatase A-like enzyme